MFICFKKEKKAKKLLMIKAKAVPDSQDNNTNNIYKQRRKNIQRTKDRNNEEFA
jgi:hypothetical protein